jgi:hypothetical protein
VGTNIVIHDDRRSLIASAQAGDVANTNFLCVGTLKSGVESRADLVGSAEMATHVGTDAHVDFWRRAEMKVRIEAGYGVDLTDGDIDFRRKRCEAVGGQVTEISLDGP